MLYRAVLLSLAHGGNLSPRAYRAGRKHGPSGRARTGRFGKNGDAGRCLAAKNKVNLRIRESRNTHIIIDNSEKTPLKHERGMPAVLYAAWQRGLRIWDIDPADLRRI